MADRTGSATTLDSRLRMIACLQVAQDTGARRRWAALVHEAAGLGIDVAKLEAIERGDEYADALAPSEQSVAAFAHELVHLTRPRADTLRDVRLFLEPRELSELTSAIGHVWTLARHETALGVDGGRS